MIRRLLAALAFVGILCFCAWYLLRWTPDKEVTFLREAIDALLRPNSTEGWQKAVKKEDIARLALAGQSLSDRPTRLEIARQYSEAILKFSPASEYDLGVRGGIEETAGDWKAALKIYDRLATLRIEPAWAHLRRGECYRRLGQWQKAIVELNVVADEFPFAVNMRIGRTEQDHLLMPDRAMGHFKQALEAARKEKKDPEQKLEALTAIAESYNALLTTSEFLVQRTPEAAREVLLGRIGELRTQRDKALTEAQELQRTIFPRNKVELVREKLRFYRLKELFLERGKLLDGIQSLEDAVREDLDRRFTPIYFKLGEVKLRLSERAEPSEPRKWAEEAEGHFKQALAFKDSILLVSQNEKEESAEDAEKIEEKPDTPDLAGRTLALETLRDELRIRIAQRYLGTSTNWRVYEKVHADTVDALETKEQLDRIINKKPGAADLPARAQLVRGLGLLRDGHDTEGLKLLEDAVVARTPADRAAKQLRLAEFCFELSPDTALFERVMDAWKKEEVKPSMSRAYRLYSRAIQRWQGQRGYHERDGKKEEAEKLAAEIARLSAAREAMVDTALRQAQRVDEFMYLSSMVAGVGGFDASIRVLKEGKARILAADDETKRDLARLQGKLASLLFEKGLAQEVAVRRGRKLPEGTPDEPWLADYQGSLDEYLAIFQRYPFRKDVLSRILRIIAAFANARTQSPLALNAAVQPLFGGVPQEDAALFADLLVRLSKREFQTVIQNLERLRKAQSLKPASTLILVEVLLYEAGQQEKFAAGDVAVVQRAEALRQIAREMLNEEAARSPQDIPIQVQRVWALVQDVRDGQEVSDELVDKSNQLTATIGGEASLVTPVNLILSEVLRKRFKNLVDSPVEEGEFQRTTQRLNTLLHQRRTVLRRAILGEPDNPDLYLSLAETFLITGKGSKMDEELKGGEHLIEPDPERALGVLEAAPDTAAVIENAGRLLLNVLKRPAAALEKFIVLARIDPSEQSLRLVVASHIAAGEVEASADPSSRMKDAHAKARAFLRDFEDRVLPKIAPERADRVANFPGFKEVLYGMIDQEESEQATSVDRKSLEATAVGHYRAATDWYSKQGKRAPVEVGNNLAWLLAANPATARDALEIIKQTLDSVPAEAPRRLKEMLDDTQGWVHFHLGEYKEAADIYGRIIGSPFALAGFFTRYARTLHARYDKFREEDDLKAAKKWVEKSLTMKQTLAEKREATEVKIAIDIAFDRLRSNQSQ